MIMRKHVTSFPFVALCTNTRRLLCPHFIRWNETWLRLVGSSYRFGEDSRNAFFKNILRTTYDFLSLFTAAILNKFFMKYFQSQKKIHSITEELKDGVVCSISRWDAGLLKTRKPVILRYTSSTE